MKLIFCPECQDVVKLDYNGRYCKCRASFGAYEDDGLNAKIGGLAIPLGIHNGSLASALKRRPHHGLGERFEAFVIPSNCPTIEEQG